MCGCLILIFKTWKVLFYYDGDAGMKYFLVKRVLQLGINFQKQLTYFYEERTTNSARDNLEKLVNKVFDIQGEGTKNLILVKYN